MPMIKPKKDESKKKFIDRCMSDETMQKEFPDSDQCYAVCEKQWAKKEKKSESTDGIERRFIQFDDAEVRVDKKEGEPTRIIGYFAKFGKLSENLGGFREKIERGFFAEALKTSDTVDLFNHDPNYVLGRVSAKTLKLSEDDTGLRYECIAPDTQLIRDLVISPIERGDIKGNSFGFRLNGDGDYWEEDEEGMITRTLKKGGCRELIDGSQVTFPAYPDTKVALRSMDGWKDELEEKRMADIEKAKREEEAAKRAELEGRNWETDLKKKKLALKKKEITG